MAKPKLSSRPSGSARNPAGASHWLDEGAAHARAGRTRDAIAAYERAARADPADFRADYSLATLYLHQGRADLAAPRLERVIQRRPDLFEAQHNLGAALQTLERWAGAAQAYERALALRPGAVETRRNLAIVLAVLGRVDEAIAHHRQLTDDPGAGLWALTRIALLNAAAITDADLARMRSAADAPAIDAETRIGLKFAIGEVLERATDDEAAFAAFSDGNRLKRQALEAQGVNPAALLEAHRAAARRVIDLYTEDFVRRHAADGLATTAPIFIVGMPRSGSTLI
jgi:tetratricopeptide (TPR) repeat protein